VKITIPIDAPELGDIASQLRGIGNQLLALTERIGTLATQDQVDTIAANINAAVGQINSAIGGIRADIDELKAQANVDTSGLEARVAEVTAAAQSLSDLDTENPAPPAG